MKVKDKMTPNPIVIALDTTVAEAMQLMRDHSIRRLPVMNRGKLVGIVTERDLSEVSPSPATSLSVFEINYLLAKTKIKDILPKNSQVITVSPDTFIEEAARLMRAHKVGGIPVMENGKLVGIITETNIFDALIDMLGVYRKGTRIDMKVEDRVGVVAEISSIIASKSINIENIVLYPDLARGDYNLILRIDTEDPQEVLEELKHRGYEIKSVFVKR
ncbi:MAG TPA: CBS domain-containing protein [Syntrophothermus lipocalidus]|uniref:CBS domain containing membrane protein n=1 Tax=Syntrophothermus lipocalidus (strain DSM 12680 / TGB-C1) TaxID=643648 RepID=D7CKA9_SYNLT|nr:CBS and ACT domain-containing protein [Syntrophothermus lipocalidus]ADI03093.1 CBS domain containing membrane protein [Syntrophothermus lipocalidus DSM 12680]HHV76637.1 CBS domain-containing protein [Syntrophothermus lipocalidus]HOV42425.1 CBS and ACT domain-containing protein [Syntrophothermus lipocalidus]